jgi:transcriptional regulator
MYIPKANEETRVPTMHALMHAEPLATLVTMGTGGLFASHIPLVLHDVDGTPGILRGHVSRANTQWRTADTSVEALAIFAGPQHYITPAWYEGKAINGKVVPTWNYVVVHAYGTLRVIEDKDWMLRHLETLTDQSEAGMALPWKVSDAPAEFIQQMMNGIVGFELAITRLEGKWKASQNRSAEDKRRVAEGLSSLGTAESAAMASVVTERG